MRHSIAFKQFHSGIDAIMKNYKKEKNKITVEQQIRIIALTAAINWTMSPRYGSKAAVTLLEIARDYEKYIRIGEIE